MDTLSDQIIDARDSDPIAYPVGDAVYVDLGDPARLPRLRFTDAIDALRVSEACARAALSLRELETGRRGSALAEALGG